MAAHESSKQTDNDADTTQTQSHSGAKRLKEQTQWLYNSHEAPDSLSDHVWETICQKTLINPTNSAVTGRNERLTIKFEPFILHVQARSLDRARQLHAMAIQSGMRNSGLTVASSGKITLAVRSTLAMGKVSFWSLCGKNS